MAASALLLRSPPLFPYGLALLDCKMPGRDDLELDGHLKQILSKPVDFGHLIPLIENVGGTP